MKVFVEKTGKHHTIRYSGSARNLLQQLDVNPETVLIVRNGTLVTEDTKLEESDEINLISVISGG